MPISTQTETNTMTLTAEKLYVEELAPDVSVEQLELLVTDGSPAVEIVEFPKETEETEQTVEPKRPVFVDMASTILRDANPDLAIMVNPNVDAAGKRSDTRVFLKPVRPRFQLSGQSTTVRVTELSGREQLLNRQTRRPHNTIPSGVLRLP